ncbi:DENN domain and WD repeat-containing protein SCD1-like [Cucumis melo var. makuwa]|uniref:DENN domain and WD repeat-containing protein SCD1-like n=1 Tax=Cucumis melo var. makuwa TaxID=1194695 RepID=A0A5D3E5T3_CUCMM|nr:DENN domain and WD repeat-containing protein SCD1-like [Cucumis melo var. makuwa]
MEDQQAHPDISTRQVAFWQSVIDKIRKKFDKWRRFNLPRGGRTTLCNFVLANLPTCCMSSFAIPDKVVSSIERIIRNFLWEGHGSEINHLWVGDIPLALSICSPKLFRIALLPNGLVADHWDHLISSWSIIFHRLLEDDEILEYQDMLEYGRWNLQANFQNLWFERNQRTFHDNEMRWLKSVTPLCSLIEDGDSQKKNPWVGNAAIKEQFSKLFRIALLPTGQ